MFGIFTSENTLEGLKSVFTITKRDLIDTRQSMYETLRSVRNEWHDEKYMEVARMVWELDSEISARIDDIDRMKRHVEETLTRLQNYRRS